MAECAGCGRWEPPLERIDGKEYCAHCGEEWPTGSGFLGLF